MNIFIFCVILSFSSSLAFRVSFYEVDVKSYGHGGKPVPDCTQHKFIYQIGDVFTMYLQLANNSAKAIAVVKNESGDTYLTRAFWPEGEPIRFHPKFDKITIDVELSVNNTCVRETILEGRKMSTTGTNITAFKYNDICLKKNRCMVVVDHTRECKDQKLTPMPCEHGRHVEVVAPADNQRSKTIYYGVKNNPETSRAKDDSKEGAANTYFIIMIITSIISAVALILLLIIAIRQRCWISNPPGIPQILPTNPNPFYGNLLFRKECQQEIQELEQRVYDVVAGENEYVEVYNRSGTK